MICKACGLHFRAVDLAQRAEYAQAQVRRRRPGETP